MAKTKKTLEQRKAELQKRIDRLDTIKQIQDLKKKLAKG